MCRLGCMFQPRGSGPGSDWFLTQLFGYFGAALSAGLVLRLDASQLVSGLGFAYMQMAGGKEGGLWRRCDGTQHLSGICSYGRRSGDAAGQRRSSRTEFRA